MDITAYERIMEKLDYITDILEKNDLVGDDDTSDDSIDNTFDDDSMELGD
jgi:hypothetical protein